MPNYFRTAEQSAMHLQVLEIEARGEDKLHGRRVPNCDMYSTRMTVRRPKSAPWSLVEFPHVTN